MPPFTIDDDAYLFKTDRIFLSRYEGEPYFNGYSLSSLLTRGFGFKKVSMDLLGEGYKGLRDALSKIGWPVDEALDIIWLVESYNVYSPIHLTYIVLRASGIDSGDAVENTYRSFTPYVESILNKSESLFRGDRLECLVSKHLVVKPPRWVEPLLKRLLLLGVVDREGVKRVRDIYKRGCRDIDPILPLVTMKYGFEMALKSYILPKLGAAEALYIGSRPSLEDVLVEPYYSGWLGDYVAEEVSDEEHHNNE